MSAVRKEQSVVSLVQGNGGERYHEGWRRGKPEEDPAKTKRWGFISAKPSEYLIRISGGEVKTSGQGATVFKWPWESVAVVPTTVQRLSFVADQITAEKVGVQVTGIAVYRIAQPLIAFRMLNFSFPERAQEKLAEMMQEMFIGAARRLVANLTVEHCLTRRKEGLATELMREIAPVVQGSGRLEDQTQRGWGVIVDTIEIQDVRVMSQAVFANLQARYRHDIERQAREAELARDRAVKQDEASSERQIELARVASQTEIRRERQTAEEQARLEKLSSDARVEHSKQAQERAARQAAVEAERELQLQALDAELEVRRQKQAAEERAQLEQLSAELRLTQAQIQAEAEKARLGAEAELARHTARLALEQQAAAVLAARAQVAEARHRVSEVEVKTYELELKKQQLANHLEHEHSTALKAIENTVTRGLIELTVAQKLPELAAAFQQKMGQVHVTSIDGANPFGYVAAAVEGVLGLARSAGLKVPAAPTSAEQND